MEKKEKELLILLQRDPEGGICRIIEEYGAAVKTICSHILRTCDQGLIEDAVQESFFHLWKNIIEGKKIKKSIKAYLYQIARNCALDSLRYYQKQQCLSIDNMEYEGIEELMLKTNTNVEEIFARNYNYQLVHEVIEEMQEPDRTIFILRYFYNYSVKEISKQVELKEDNVESRIRRNKKKLQARLLKGGIL